MCHRKQKRNVLDKLPPMDAMYTYIHIYICAHPYVHTTNKDISTPTWIYVVAISMWHRQQIKNLVAKFRTMY